MALILIFQLSYAQTYEIRTTNLSGGVIGVQLRETSGTGTPTTSNQVTDIKFGIKWLQSYGSSLDLNSSITTSYFIMKSGSRSSSGLYYFQSFYANNTPFSIPSNWTTGNWITIMSISNNLQGSVSTGNFEICETNFDATTNPNFGLNLTDYTPTINGQANNVPLPIELSSFTASVNLNNINLNWNTSTEVNNNGFEVERKADENNSSWSKIGFVQGYGNSNSPKEYSFIDKNLTGGTKFTYRLKQIDNDGKYQYSKEIEVEVIPKEYELSQNYPNPFNPATDIKYNLPEASRVTLNVYNIIGQKVASLVNGEVEAGFHSVTFDGRDLPSGTYIYRLQTPNYTQTKKMVLLK